MKERPFNRRRFFTILGAGGASLAFKPLSGIPANLVQTTSKPSTNISDAVKTPRSSTSMPGRYPGKVVIVKNNNSVVDDIPVEAAAYEMLQRSMLELTGQKDIKKAWRLFVKPGEKIGLKVNPVAGKLLFTSHAVVKSVVKQLTESGIDRKDIIIWDRREMELKDTGFTQDNYPGIAIRGTELQDEEGSFVDKNGKLYGERNIDKEWYYWADVEGEYDAETMPYMVNGGKFSYFTKIVTKEVDKIINIPILKNAGGSITNAMKNLAFGSVSNTGRLHAKLWNDTCAEVCAFAPLRDKTVLNICDGLRGCFNGGPGANPQFICNYNSLLVSTDPVAMDRVGYDLIAEKRIAEGLQKTSSPESLTFLTMATSLGLGVSDKSKIDVMMFDIS
ncbi:MAG TPA: hypothetical protein DEO60_06735 [Bacteroidales bacterium]|nr:hypothetical protein [Bacteroidales bacterium]HBZ20803.1 hypothetical protein [Bacteroidales bacterium]